MPATDLSRDIYSVSRLNREVRAVLEGSFPMLWVEGELSNLAQPASGHIYFSLKDAAAQVRCAMFRAKRLLLGFRPANGQQVLVRARVGLYEGRGDFQLVVEHMEPAGEGALRLAFERLKRKLSAAGLFDEAVKRPLPRFPRQVGLITSPTGAAVRDLISVLGRRFPAVALLIYPVQVQGADDELVEALALANRRAECDVLILARGGGSLEDLMSFNTEALARAIRASAIPVVTGVGHEIDLTIADLAADRRGAPPSAAAELVSPSPRPQHQLLLGLEGRLTRAQGRVLDGLRRRRDASARHLRLLHPAAALQRRQQRTDDLERRLAESLRRRLDALGRRRDGLTTRLGAAAPTRALERVRGRTRELRTALLASLAAVLALRRQRLAGAVHALEALSPLATLSRGYAIVRRLPDGRIVRDVAQLEPGDRIEARLARGAAVARVEECREHERADDPLVLKTK